MAGSSLQNNSCRVSFRQSWPGLPSFSPSPEDCHVSPEDFRDSSGEYLGHLGGRGGAFTRPLPESRRPLGVRLPQTNSICCPPKVFNIQVLPPLWTVFVNEGLTADHWSFSELHVVSKVATQNLDQLELNCMDG